MVIDSKLTPIERWLENGLNPLLQTDVEELWEQKLTSACSGPIKRYKAIYSVTNGPCTELSFTNAVLEAFLLAYNTHQHLVLSPDDMWLVVCIQFAEYVNKHVEQLRSLFVEHSDGKKLLRVIESRSSDENDCK